MPDETVETTQAPSSDLSEKKWPADPNYRMRQSGQGPSGPIGNTADIPIMKELETSGSQQTTSPSASEQALRSTDYRLRQSEQGQLGPIGNVEDIPIMKTSEQPQQNPSTTTESQPTETPQTNSSQSSSTSGS